MLPADEIYHILEDLKKLRQERGYTKSRFESIRKKMQPLVDKYYWRKDEFLDLVTKKDKILGYNNIKKELKILNSLLDYIKKMLKKEEFIAALESSKIDIEQFKRAIKFNKLKLKVLKDRNKDCRKKMQTFVKVIKITTNRKDFEKALADWDTAQSKIAYIDRLEDSLENKIMVEQTRKFPKSVKQRTGIWKIATAYAMATMIGFGVATGSYAAGEGISFGGGNVYAEEVQTQAPYKTKKELLEILKRIKYLGTRTVDKFSELPGKDTILKGYRLGNKTITTYEFKKNNRIYAFATKENGKFRWYPDRTNDGYFEAEEEKADIQLEKYGFRVGN